VLEAIANQSMMRKAESFLREDPGLSGFSCEQFVRDIEDTSIKKIKDDQIIISRLIASEFDDDEQNILYQYFHFVWKMQMDPVRHTHFINKFPDPADLLYRLDYLIKKMVYETIDYDELAQLIATRISSKACIFTPQEIKSQIIAYAQAAAAQRSIFHKLALQPYGEVFHQRIEVLTHIINSYQLLKNHLEYVRGAYLEDCSLTLLVTRLEILAQIAWTIHSGIHEESNQFLFDSRKELTSFNTRLRHIQSDFDNELEQLWSAVEGEIEEPVTLTNTFYKHQYPSYKRNEGLERLDTMRLVNLLFLYHYQYSEVKISHALIKEVLTNASYINPTLMLTSGGSIMPLGRFLVTNYERIIREFSLILGQLLGDCNTINDTRDEAEEIELVRIDADTSKEDILNEIFERNDPSDADANKIELLARLTKKITNQTISQIGNNIEILPYSLLYTLAGLCDNPLRILCYFDQGNESAYRHGREFAILINNYLEYDEVGDADCNLRALLESLEGYFELNNKKLLTKWQYLSNSARRKTAAILSTLHTIYTEEGTNDPVSRVNRNFGHLNYSIIY